MLVNLLAETDLGYLPHVTLAAYLLLLIGLGVVGYLRGKTTEEDYYLAGRNQGFIVSSLTIMATFFSSWAMLGAPGMVYRDGVAFVLFALNVPFSGSLVYLLGSRIARLGRAKGYVTPADLISDYYGDSVVLRVLVAMIGFLYVLPYVVIQIKAGGHLAQQMFPDAKPLSVFGSEVNVFQAGSSVLAVVTMLYVIVGGMRSVAWTDVIQGGLLLFGMLVAGAATVSALGGVGSYFDKVSALPREALSVPGTTGAWPAWKMMTICMVASIGSMIQPAQWMRYYAARSVNALRRSSVIFAVVLTGCFLFGVMLVGLGGQVLYPTQTDGKYRIVVKQEQAPPQQGQQGVEGEAAEVEVLLNHEQAKGKWKGLQPHDDVKKFDQVLVRTLRDHAPSLLGEGVGKFIIALIMVAILAASMSTADSNLHALSGVLTRDVYDRFVRPKASQRERMWVGRGVIVGATGLALLLVYIGDSNPNFAPLKMIVSMGLTAIAFSSQLIPATLDILFLRWGTRAGVIAGAVVGLAVVFTLAFPAVVLGESGAENATWIGEAKRLLDLGFCGLVVNVVVFVGVSAVTRKPDPERVEEFRSIMKGSK